MRPTGLSRRAVLSGAGALIILGGIPAVRATVPSWDETWDVIIVGSGYAGLAAAIEARHAGAKVLLIEKMEAFGGNSSLSTGDMAVPGTPIQKRLGILNDSPERMADDLLRLGKTNDPNRCRIVARNALDTWNWTQTELGVHWVPDALQNDEGQSVPRGCMVPTRSGRAIIAPAVDRAQKLEAVLRTRTKLLSLITSPSSGRVTGVEVREGYQFPDETTGSRSGSERFGVSFSQQEGSGRTQPSDQNLILD